MRWFVSAASVLILGASGAMGVACKGGDKTSKDDKKSAEPVVTAKAHKVGVDLKSRRQALMKARAKIRERRAKLKAQLHKIQASGGDTRVVTQKIETLRKDESSLIEEQAKWIQRSDQYLRRLQDQVSNLNTTPRTGTERLTAREGVLASREKSVAEREARVSKREAALADRERKVAKREQLECAVAPAPTTIVRRVEVKGSKYTRHDVDPLLRSARRLMSRRGILRSDLSGPARGLEREATRAMKKGDYGAARFAAATLVGTVRSIRINKGFIAAKMNRLSRYMKGKRLNHSKQSKVDALFRQATRYYGDGRFRSANSRLNGIYGVID